METKFAAIYFLSQNLSYEIYFANHRRVII